MKRVRFVTFPRSGHHWLVSMLEERSIPGWAYDEHHSTGNTLENAPHITAQKTHDFALDVEKRSDVQHVIQIRNYHDSITSWCRMLNCDEGHLAEAAAIDRDFRIKWMEKWIVDPLPNRLVVRYCDLLDNTDYWVDRVVAHIS